jgi:1,2-phenylacetyl-CoA epoxidase catalytic subunit
MTCKRLGTKEAIKNLTLYNENEDTNDHAGNFLLLAKLYGGEREIEICQKNLNFREKNGYVDSSLSQRALSVTMSYYRFLVDDATSISQEDLKELSEEEKGE